MKKLLFILCLSISGLWAQEVSSILSDGDIDKFIKTYQPLAKELEALGDDWEKVQNPTTAEAMEASSEMNAVFKKYGWDEDYLQKFSTIISGTAYVGVLQQMDEMDDTQKQMMQGYMTQMKSLYGTNISEEDVKKIKPRYKEIMEVIEE